MGSAASAGKYPEPGIDAPNGRHRGTQKVDAMDGGCWRCVTSRLREEAVAVECRT